MAHASKTSLIEEQVQERIQRFSKGSPTYRVQNQLAIFFSNQVPSVKWQTMKSQKILIIKPSSMVVSIRRLVFYVSEQLFVLSLKKLVLDSQDVNPNFIRTAFDPGRQTMQQHLAARLSSLATSHHG